ncbi:unnamed protein product [Paramecium primaurelia]|uniref:Transmembrane protein n=1 Tax=Paramecium primaurelia TaxID=5886 RepID=A0A8S1P947_PARPR|nr:unnamed protein product [Paramecium primaurelia]
MQIQRLQFQLHFLLIFFTYGQENQSIFCNDNQITFYKFAQYPAFFNETTKEYQIKENVDFLEIIQISEVHQLNNNYTLIHIHATGDEILKVFNNQNQYYLERSQIQLHFNQNNFHTSNLISFQSNFQLPLCNQFHSIYQKYFQFLIICEQENIFIIYILEFQNQNYTIKTISLNKTNNECQLSINQQNNEKQIYISFINCLNWIIYVIDFKEIQELVKSNKFFQDQILRTFYIRYSDPYLIFDHQIYTITKDLKLHKIYEDFDRKILTCSKMLENLIIIVEQQNNEEIFDYKNSFHILITRKEKPKEIFELNNKIILHYENYIEHLETSTLSFKLYLKIDKLIIVNFQNKFFFGLNSTKIFFFQQNSYSPYFNCNQYKNQNNISFLTSNLYYYDEITFVTILKNISDPFEIFQNYSFVEKLIKQDFSITFDKQKILNGVIPNITPLNNAELQCNNKLEKITCISQYIKSTQWFLIKKFMDGSYGILFQQRKNLYFIECKHQKLTFLGTFQNFQQSNIFSYQNYIILIQNNKTKILAIEVSISLEYMILEFEEQILDVQVFNYQLIVILESCQIFSLQSPLKMVELKIKKFQISQINCRNMHYLNDQVSFFYNQSTLMVFENFVTTTILLNNLQINNINKIYLTQNIYLIEEQQQDIITLSKQVYFNYQFIKLQEYQKLHFEYSYPLNYILNSNFLVVAAQADDTCVLLVYSLQTKKQNSLIQIIDVDYFSFHFIDNDRLVYIYQNQIYQQNIGEIKLYCSTQYFFEFNKNLQLKIRVELKSNILQTRIQTLNISLINCIENLIALNTTKIQLKEEDANKIILIDPRKYISGPLNKISSQNDSIILPIQIINNIDFAECTFFVNSICINTQENYVILNILENKKRINFSQIK